MQRFFTLFFVLLNLQLTAQEQYGNEWIDYEKTYYKIEVEEDGWVHIPQSTLVTLGLPTDASVYELQQAGEAVPLYTSTDGTMGENDFLAFLGKKNDGAFDTQLYKQNAWQPGQEFSLFSQQRTYFLSVNPSNNTPLRYTVQETEDKQETEQYYNTYVRKELHNVFHAGKPFNIGGIDNTFSEFDEGEGYVGLMIDDEAEYTQNLICREPYYQNGGQAEVSVEVIGRSNDPFVYFDHHLNIELNDQYCNSIIYPGFNTEDITFPIPVSQVELISRFKFTSVGDLSDEKDRNSVISLELKYPRYYRFDESDNFPIYFTDVAAHDFRAFGLENWQQTFLLDSENATLNQVNIRNGKRFFHLDEAISQANRRTAWFIDPAKADRVVLPNQVASKNFIDFGATSQQGDYIMLSNQLLSGAEISTYAGYRSSEAGGAHTVSLVWVSELYDQFAYGIKNHPLAIRNFVNYAIDNWELTPQHLLLLGKSLDYRHLTSQDPDDYFVPTYGYPPCDFLLTTRSPNHNLPQLAVGRIPARNKSQIQDYLNKVIEIESLSYENCDLDARSWTKKVFHAVSGNNDAEANYFVSFLNELEPLIESSAMGAEVLRTLIQSGYQIEVQEDLPALMEEGIGLISYMGHPTTDGTIYWNFDIETPEFYNNPGRYPLINANSCFSGNIHHNGTPVMAEDYVLAANRGAIGYIAIVNFGWPSFMQPFNIEFYEQLGNSQYGGEIGKVIQAAYGKVFLDAQAQGISLDSQLKQLQSVVYAGDPALRTFSHAKPDYHIEAELAAVSPSVLTTSQDSFLLKLSIQNTGRGLVQDLKVRVNRTFPDGSSSLVFDDAISAPSSKVIKAIAINNPDNLSAGLHQFSISLDPDNEIDELCEENNEVTIVQNIENVSCPDLSLELIDFASVQCIDDVPNLLAATPAGGDFYIDNQLINYNAPAEWGEGVHFLEYVYTDPVTQCSYSSYLDYEIIGSVEQNFSVQTSTCINTPALINLEGAVQEGVSYHWDFGEGANMAEAFTPGPHAVTYNQPGPKLITLSLIKGGCTYVMNNKQVFVEEPLAPVTITGVGQSGNTISIELDTDQQVNYYTIQVNGESSWNFLPESVYVIEDLEPETEYVITITPLGNFTTGNNCGSGVPSNALTVQTTTCPALELSVDGLDELYCSDAVDFVDIFAVPFGGKLIGNGIEEVVPGSMSYRFYPNRAGQGTHTITHDYFEETSGCNYYNEYDIVVAMNPVARLTGDTVVCEGSASMLVALPGMSEYIWNDEPGTSNVLAVSEAGNYSLTVTDDLGCSDGASLNVIESTSQAPQVDLGPDIILESAFALDTLLDAGVAQSYLWSTLETTQTIYAETGFYQVAAYNEEGCPGRDSISIEYYVSGVQNSNEFDFIMAPIPAYDKLNVKSARPFTQLSIFDLNGRLLFKNKFDATYAHQLSVSNLPAGYFIVELLIDNERVRKKICAFSE